MPASETRPDAPDMEAGPGSTNALKPAVAVAAMVLVLGAFVGGAIKWSNHGQNVDVIAAAFPGWYFVQNGSLDVTPYLGANPWFVETDNGVFSNRSPGIIGVSIAAYAVTEPFTDQFEMWPSTVAAVLTSFLAVVIVALMARREREDLFLPTLVLLGLGSATWGVASGQMWSHGPAQLAVAIALWYYSRSRHVASGWAMAVAILIRPPTAVLALVLGLGLGWIRRSWRPVFAMGIPSMLGAAVLGAYNSSVFDSPNPFAPYDAAGGGIQGKSLYDWLSNAVAGFFSPQNGLLAWSPWIAVCAIGLVAGWKRIKPEHRLALLAASVFLLVHFWLNRASGGLSYNYRYPLEALTLIIPVLVMPIPRLLDRRLPRMALVLAGGIAVFLQGSYIFLAGCVDIGGMARCSLFG